MSSWHGWFITNGSLHRRDSYAIPCVRPGQKTRHALAEQSRVLATLSRWRPSVQIRPGVPDCRRSETGPAISLGVAWSPSGRGSRFKPGTVWGQISPTRLIIVTGTVAQFGRGARLRTELLGVRISPVLLWGFVSHGSLSVKPLSINSEVVMRGSIPSKLNLLRPPGPQSEKICDTSISRSIA